MIVTWEVDETRLQRVIVARPSHTYRVAIVARMVGKSLTMYFDFGDVFGDPDQELHNLNESARLIKRKLPKIKKGLKEALIGNAMSGTFEIGLPSKRW